MKLSFSLEKWYALSSALSTKSDWQAWANKPNHDWTLPLPSLTSVPMMQARRMSVPSRLAVEVGLKLIDEKKVDFAIFVSRHGELEKTYKILTTLNQDRDISPTDFTVSVHNTASGLLSIIAKQAIPITSISANQDGFHQGLIEAQSLLNNNHDRVLLIDFDGTIPDMYQTQVQTIMPMYAVGFILTQGNEISVEAVPKNEQAYQANYPQSLAFLHGYMSQQKKFILQGNFQYWQWTVNQ